MEAPKGGGRITPLPPPEPDGSSRPVERATQPWLPALVAIAGIVAFALWLAGSASDPTPDAASSGGRSTLAPLGDQPTTTNPPVQTIAPTTTTLPDLGELLPWLQGSLVLFTDSNELIVWDHTLPAPSVFELSASDVVAVEPQPQTLNFIAYETAGRVKSLFLGGWRRQEPIFVGTRGFAWDPAGSSTLMWVGQDQVTLETALYRHSIAGPIERIAPVPDETELIAWTDQGIITQEHFGPAVTFVNEASDFVVQQPTYTTLRTIEGEPIRNMAAETLRAAPNGTLIAIGTGGAFANSGLSLDDGVFVPPGVPVVIDTPASPDSDFTVRLVPTGELLGDGEPPISTDGRWDISDDGAWVGRTVTRGITTTVVANSLDSLGVRVMTLPSDGTKTTVGFSQDGEWFFSYSHGSEVLIATRIQSGAQFTVPIESPVRLRGAYVRPIP